jgi:hypothetical protein
MLSEFGAVFPLFTKSMTASAPRLLVMSLTPLTGSPAAEFIISSAPNLFASDNFFSSISTIAIRALVIAFVSCTAISPRPPAPTMATVSPGCASALFTAVYAVRPEHASDAEEFGSSPCNLIRYL